MDSIEEASSGVVTTERQQQQDSMTGIESSNVSDGGITVAQDGYAPKRVGRPRGRKSGLVTNTTLPRRRWARDGVEHLTYFRTLTKEQLLQKAQYLPPDLDLYDVCRRPRTLTGSIDAILSRTVRLSDTGLTEDLSCPICMGTYQSVAVVKDCLHRFCEECIERWLRTGHQECPKCRNRIPSRRSLRADPIFQRIVQRLFPDVQDFERLNDKAVAIANRRRTGLVAADGFEVRSRRGRGCTSTFKLQRESGVEDDQEEQLTVASVTPPVTSTVVELQLIPQTPEVECLQTLKLKPLKALSINHVLRMIKSATSTEVASLDIRLGLPNSRESIDPTTRISALLSPTHVKSLPFLKIDIAFRQGSLRFMLGMKQIVVPQNTSALSLR